MRVSNLSLPVNSIDLLIIHISFLISIFAFEFNFLQIGSCHLVSEFRLEICIHGSQFLVHKFDNSVKKNKVKNLKIPKILFDLSFV